MYVCVYAKVINSLLHSTILALLFFGRVVSMPAGRKVGSRFDSWPSPDKDKGEVIRTIVDFSETSRDYIPKNLQNYTKKRHRESIEVQSGNNN
jgi:hypothetical protein